MFIIELITDRFFGGRTEKIVGYKTTDEDARKYCERKTEEIKGTYNEKMGIKFYKFYKIDMLND